MVNKIIGVDIDGVITDEGPADNNIWHNALCNFLGKEVKRVKDKYDFIEAYNLPEKTINEFIENKIHEIYWNVKPASGAKETLEKLHVKGFTIFLITARNERFRNLTEKWLDKYSIPYDKLFHEDNKAPLAEKLNIELFLEDNEKNARQLFSYNIPVILVNKYHNQEVKNERLLYRVSNWQEINEIIFNEIFRNITENVS